MGSSSLEQKIKMVRAPCGDKMGLKKGAWTWDEDQLLVSYILKYGHGNWRALPKHAGLLRCGKSCRLRWKNYLRPDIKRGNYTLEEEEIIIRSHELLGNRWSAIAAKLPGRTDNEIKNVWHTYLKKRSAHHGCPKKKTDADAALGNQTCSLHSCSSGQFSLSSPASTDISYSTYNNSVEEDEQTLLQVPIIDESFWSMVDDPVDNNATVDVLESEDANAEDDMDFWLGVLLGATGNNNNNNNINYIV